jgi:4-hydroxythreonine-4-phosphate dehydrogenase
LAEWIVVGPEGTDVNQAVLSVGLWQPGGPSDQAGRLAALAIERATSMALAGKVAALVTAPIDKAALSAAGWSQPGHTELLRDLAGVRDVAMMLAADQTHFGTPLRVVLATTHLPLRSVPAALSPELLVRQAHLTHRALRGWWGIHEPRIALCAVNPHASDGGLFGDEEARVMEPAVRSLRGAGVQLFGPIPADTVFTRALRREFDAVIAPYHDVGMAAFKTVAFGRGVNVTLGLPFPRTSPDHGTALDIAGRDVADPASIKEAMRLAVRLAGGFDTMADSG